MRLLIGLVMMWSSVSLQGALSCATHLRDPSTFAFTTFSPDSRYLVTSVYWQSELKLWDVLSTTFMGELIPAPKNKVGHITKVEIAGHHYRALVHFTVETGVGAYSRVAVMDLLKNTILFSPPNTFTESSQAKLSPEGNYFAVFNQAELSVFSVADRKLVAERHFRHLSDVAFHPSEQWIALANDAQTTEVSVHALSDFRLVFPVARLSEDQVASLQWAPKQTPELWAKNGQSRRLWKWELGGVPKSFALSGYQTKTADGRYIVADEIDFSAAAPQARGEPHLLHVWDFERNGLVGVVKAPERAWTESAFLLDGTLFLLTRRGGHFSKEKTLDLWRQRGTDFDHTGIISDAHFPEGTLFDTEAAKKKEGPAFFYATPSPDGSRIVVTVQNGYSALFDVKQLQAEFNR